MIRAGGAVGAGMLKRLKGALTRRWVALLAAEAQARLLNVRLAQSGYRALAAHNRPEAEERREAARAAMASYLRAERAASSWAARASRIAE